MYSTMSRTSVGNRLLFASLSQAKKRLKNLTLVLRVAVRRLPTNVKVDDGDDVEEDEEDGEVARKCAAGVSVSRSMSCNSDTRRFRSGSSSSANDLPSASTSRAHPEKRWSVPPWELRTQDPAP